VIRGIVRRFQADLIQRLADTLGGQFLLFLLSQGLRGGGALQGGNVLVQPFDLRDQCFDVVLDLRGRLLERGAQFLAGSGQWLSCLLVLCHARACTISPRPAKTNFHVLTRLESARHARKHQGAAA